MFVKFLINIEGHWTRTIDSPINIEDHGPNEQDYAAIPEPISVKIKLELTHSNQRMCFKKRVEIVATHLFKYYNIMCYSYVYS